MRYDKMGGFAQFLVPTVITCRSLVMSELPKTFPNLRWGFIEASAQWVPWVVMEATRRTGAKGFPKLPFRVVNQVSFAVFPIYLQASAANESLNYTARKPNRTR